MLSALNLDPGDQKCWYERVVWFPSQAQQESVPVKGSEELWAEKIEV